MMKRSKKNPTDLRPVDTATAGTTEGENRSLEAPTGLTVPYSRLLLRASTSSGGLRLGRWYRSGLRGRSGPSAPPARSTTPPAPAHSPPEEASARAVGPQSPSPTTP